MNRQVKIQTGTIKVQATFPNPGHLLRPGMYAKIRAAAEVRHEALLVPQDAVLETQGQYQVAVVGSDNKVTMRTVEVGQQAGGLQIIEKGVSPGERVITEGLQKVRDGMEVNPHVVAAEPALDSTPGRHRRSALARPNLRQPELARCRGSSSTGPSSRWLSRSFS